MLRSAVRRGRILTLGSALRGRSRLSRPQIAKTLSPTPRHIGGPSDRAVTPSEYTGTFPLPMVPWVDVRSRQAQERRKWLSAFCIGTGVLLAGGSYFVLWRVDDDKVFRSVTRNPLNSSALEEVDLFGNVLPISMARRSLASGFLPESVSLLLQSQPGAARPASRARVFTLEDVTSSNEEAESQLAGLDGSGSGGAQGGAGDPVEVGPADAGSLLLRLVVADDRSHGAVIKSGALQAAIDHYSRPQIGTQGLGVGAFHQNFLAVLDVMLDVPEAEKLLLEHTFQPAQPQPQSESKKPADGSAAKGDAPAAKAPAAVAAVDPALVAAAAASRAAASLGEDPHAAAGAALLTARYPRAGYLLAVTDMLVCGDCRTYAHTLRVLSTLARLTKDARCAQYLVSCDPQSVVFLHVIAEDDRYSRGLVPLLARDVMRNLAQAHKDVAPASPKSPFGPSSAVLSHVMPFLALTPDSAWRRWRARHMPDHTRLAVFAAAGAATGALAARARLARFTHAETLRLFPGLTAVPAEYRTAFRAHIRSTRPSSTLVPRQALRTAALVTAVSELRDRFFAWRPRAAYAGYTAQPWQYLALRPEPLQQAQGHKQQHERPSMEWLDGADRAMLPLTFLATGALSALLPATIPATLLGEVWDQNFEELMGWDDEYDAEAEEGQDEGQGDESGTGAGTGNATR